MKGFSLVTWTVFLMVFLEYSKFSDTSDTQVEIKIGKLMNIRNLASLKGCCCSDKMQIYNIVADKFRLDCNLYFWNSSCYIQLKSDKDLAVERIEVSNPKQQEKYVVEFVKNLRLLRFTYTRKRNGDPWKLIVNTANYSGGVIGRIYFGIKSGYRQRTRVPLANSFDNFKPGRSDVFHFEAPDMISDEYSIVIFDSLYENWIMTSMILTNIKKNVHYTFYHGERTYFQNYFGYKGSDTVSWIIEVDTGAIGTNSNIDIDLINKDCHTRLTLDNAEDNFQPYTTDVFHVQAKNCSGLQKINIHNQEWNGNWVLEKLNATQENGSSYIFYHNETLRGMQTFFVSQVTGVNQWEVSVCTKSSTDAAVYLRLHGRYGTTQKLRLTTPQDDFQANQCSNFTLHLKDIGTLWMIELWKPRTLAVSTITLNNSGNLYEFHAPSIPKNNLKLLRYEMGAGIFSPNIPTTGKKERECAESCIKQVCSQFYISKNTCKFDHNKDKTLKIYIFRPFITVWTLSVHFPVVVNQARVTLVEQDGGQLIYISSLKAKTFTTTFSTLSTFFNLVKSVILQIIPTKIPCTNVQIRLNKKTAKKKQILYLKRDEKCSWKITHVNPTTTIKPEETTSSRLISESTIRRQPTNTESAILRSPTNTGSTISTLSKTKPNIHRGFSIELSTVPYSSTSLTNDSITNSPSTEVEIPDKRQNHTMCKCICQKILSKEEEAEHLKELVKELKVNRNETTSYLRSKVSAPDERVSSQVIGSTAVIVMAVPFGLIFLVDFIPLLNFIYKKAVSRM